MTYLDVSGGATAALVYGCDREVGGVVAIVLIFLGNFTNFRKKILNSQNEGNRSLTSWTVWQPDWCQILGGLYDLIGPRKSFYY